MHCWWNNFKCIGESNYKKWGAIIWIDFGIACDCHNTLINSNEASNCRAVSLELDSSFFIVSTTIILNSGVYLLFDFLFSIKRPLSLDFKSIYLCYTTLSNKRGSFQAGLQLCSLRFHPKASELPLWILCCSSVIPLIWFVLLLLFYQIFGWVATVFLL